MLLVNLFPPFARACGNVPLLRALAQAVAWSPSLSAAVENDYVQPMGQSQTVNGITATVEYVIVDQKQVHIFFTLKGEGYESLSAEMPEFTPRQHCAVLGADFRQEPGTLLHFTLDYQDNDVPEGFTMAFAVTGETGTVAEDAPAAPRPKTSAGTMTQAGQPLASMSHQAAKAHKNGGVTSENPSCVSQASSRSAFIQPFTRHAPFFSTADTAA